MPSSPLEFALDTLRDGHLVGVPTDTVYGIAADPMQHSAVQRLFAAKERPDIKPIPILAASVADVRRIVLMDDCVVALADRHWPGGLTLVLARIPDLPDWIGDPKRGTVGVRIPDHPTARQLLMAAGPLAVTSANRSGNEPASNAAGAQAALGDSVAFYLSGCGTGNSASTVVDLSGDQPKVLREGPVHWSPS